MEGVYTVFLRLEESKSIEIGALGEIKFLPGVYVYVGSGRTNLEKRVRRHFGEVENRHWHIDYFSAEAEAIDSFLLPEESRYECELADILSETGDAVQEFGSSDCDCSSHLFRFPLDF